MVYDVQFFIDKFSAIPEHRWCVGFLNDGFGNCCAIGHCMDDGIHNEQTAALHDLLEPVGMASTINDGKNHNYPQPTPKQRILAALYDIRDMQKKDIDTGGKVKTVYVSVPVTITEQAKELVLG